MTSTYISPQWATAVPYVVIFLVLLGRPQGLLGARLREDVARYEPRRAEAPLDVAGRGRLGVRRCCSPSSRDDLYFQNMIILSLIFAIGAVGLNVISGYGGYVSLGQSAFLGMGAYTVGAAVDPRSTSRRSCGSRSPGSSRRRSRRCSASSRCAPAATRS